MNADSNNRNIDSYFYKLYVVSVFKIMKVNVKYTAIKLKLNSKYEYLNKTEIKYIGPLIYDICIRPTVRLLCLGNYSFYCVQNTYFLSIYMNNEYD